MTSVRCYHAPCRLPGHFIGTFQTPFCSLHWSLLTEHKRGLVLTIASFSVLHPDSRRRALSIIRECRLYLMKPQKRRAA